MADRGKNESFEHLTERFWSKVNKTDSCWNWIAGCDFDGYALFKYYRKTRRAAQIAMIITHGNIPDGMWVLHKCDNPKCVNPDHLYFGTPSQNSHDREDRNRGRCLIGGLNGYNKLVEEQVAEIKKLIGKYTGREIAKIYNVTPSLISCIKHNKIWNHV